MIIYWNINQILFFIFTSESEFNYLFTYKNVLLTLNVCDF